MRAAEGACGVFRIVRPRALGAKARFVAFFVSHSKRAKVMPTYLDRLGKRAASEARPLLLAFLSYTSGSHPIHGPVHAVC